MEYAECTAKHPWLCRFLNAFFQEQALRQNLDAGKWSSFSILYNGNTRSTPTRTISEETTTEPSGVATTSMANCGSSALTVTLGDADPKAKNYVESWSTATNTSPSSILDPGVHRWSVTAFCSQGIPEATEGERHLLRDLDFPLPERCDLQCVKETANQRPRARLPESGPRPRRSTRKALWKTMTACPLHDCPVHCPTTAALQIPADQCGDCIEVAEPVMFEDLAEGYGNIVHEPAFTTAQFAVKKTEPRELWIHANPAWTEDGIYEDIIESIEHQLQA